MEPGPTLDLQNPLETTVEERWETYLCEGVQETKDLSFTTPSWAGVTGHLQLPGSSAPDRSGKHPTGIYPSPAWDIAGAGGGVQVPDPLGRQSKTIP